MRGNYRFPPLITNLEVKPTGTMGVVREGSVTANENRIGAIVQLIFDLLIGSLVGSEVINLILVCSPLDCSLISIIYFFIRRVVLPTCWKDIS
jgi:hypothetical protein